MSDKKNIDLQSSDLPSYSEPYTDSGAIEYMTKAINKCNELKDLSNLKDLNSVLKVLSSSYFSFKLQKNKMCEIWMKKDFTQIISVIINNLMTRGYFSEDDVWFPTYYAYNTLWNFCDFNQEIATSILNTEIPKFLLANILHKPYIENINNKNIYYLIKASISIVHNVARFPENKGPFNVKELKLVMVDLIKKWNTDFLGLIAMLNLAVLVDETELTLLEEGENAITTLISHIKTAQEKPDKRFDGFMVWELVNGLRCISANDNMKKTIVQEGGIQLLLDVLKNPSNDDDIEKTLATLWNLCFDKEIKGVLKSIYDLKNVIKPFENHQSSAIKKNYNGIIWLFDNKSESIQRVKSAHVNKVKTTQKKEEWKYDIFISYCWANKPIIFNIKDELLKYKIKIWIDVDQMKGSTLEAMADGIENSQIFIMAVSEAYRTSPNCRTEAEYAFSLKKPIIPLILECKYKPTSWLGLIMGSKTYYEFSERRNFSETFNNFLKNINDILNNFQEEIIVPIHVNHDQTDSVDFAIRTVNVSGVEKWSKADVAKWLGKSQLSTFKQRFADIDGVLLSSMIELSSVAPDYLYQTLKIEFAMKLVDVLRFNAGIKNLSLN